VTFPNFKDRRFCNKTIMTIVLLHFISLMLAARFYDQLWINQTALYGTLILYLGLMPILWLWHRVTKRLPKVDTLSDIRKSFNKAKWPPYDPYRYFAFDKGLFAGLDERRKPVYIPWEEYNTTHLQLIGTTGAGKGVMATMILIQCALHGERVVIFDPKCDKHAPSVFHLAAQQAGLPFYLIDLSPEAPPQINPFRSATYPQMKDLLITTFDLDDKGGIDAFYRLLDRRAARDVIRRAGSNPTIKHMLQVADDSPYITDKEALAFLEKLTEMTELDAIDTNEGPDLVEMLSKPGFLYIIGDTMSLESLQCLKLVLLRILQIIVKRPEELADRLPVALMLDEFKHLLSPPALQALGMVRDRNCHLVLAHQSMGDLDQCKGLEPAAIRGAVLDNCGIKFIYKAKSRTTADWASDLSGTIVATVRSTDIQQSAFHAPTAHYTEVERPLFTINDIFAMPKLVGMLFGVGLARPCQAACMPKGKKPRIVPAPRAPEVPKSKAATKPKTTPENQAATPQAASPGQSQMDNADDPTRGNLT
jgi:hypothetical protein